jgi:hypothetical protein
MNRIFSFNSSHIFSFFAPLGLCLVLAACGGGGGSSSGGGSSGGGSGPVVTGNTASISVDSEVFGAVNAPFVTVTICSTSDTSECMSIDHVLLDSGSVGLRIFAQPSTTAALSTLNLTSQTAGGYPVGECAQFVQGNTWGPIMFANVQVGGEAANNVAIQVIGDPSFVAAPSACTSSGSLMDTPNLFGANGVLGIGLGLQDCGPYCVDAANVENYYFSCPSSGCTNIGMPLTNQLQNTVSLFASDNNGVIISLNSVPAGGAVSATGTLTFGIDTASNNVSANNNTILVSDYGTFTTTFEGQTYTNSYIDSGSNGIYFNPPSNQPITFCTGTGDIVDFYCPITTLNLTGQITGFTGSTSTATVNFNIANTSVLFSNNSSSNAVFNDLGGNATDISTSQRTFDWGLPFFLGQNIYVAFEGAQTTKGTGPYFGF